MREARDEWLRRLDAQQRGESTRVGYRVAIDDPHEWSDAYRRDFLAESYSGGVVLRRFVLLRRLLRWSVVVAAVRATGP